MAEVTDQVPVELWIPAMLLLPVCLILAQLLRIVDMDTLFVIVDPDLGRHLTYPSIGLDNIIHYAYFSQILGTIHTAVLNIILPSSLKGSSKTTPNLSYEYCASKNKGNDICMNNLAVCKSVKHTYLVESVLDGEDESEHHDILEDDEHESIEWRDHEDDEGYGNLGEVEGG
ncbi:hypothetical protein K504DRAFT_519733 [Pleomassaria siparia CBS 279.74]|uniref:Uncharacterized protein n=1 Tax=Pleomassaria siparia CBS 279.74 TaxID=1314801 RepID=A0A6G1JTA8_9PLEO|nr:hypothetical protein K504DRAFT_519733 [Pleomassaria siparia CBS 279.74]